MEYEGLSRFLSQILRHTPYEIGLNLDEYGYADIDVLIFEANSHGSRIEREHILALCSNSDRFKIKGNRIKATKGHSFPIKPDEEGARPPEALYHSASSKLRDTILKEGLKPLKLSSVYLFGDYVDAYIFAGRKEPAIIVVDAAQMYADGHQFYTSGDGTWFTDACPSKYLRVENNIHNIYRLYKKKIAVTTYYKKFFNIDYVVSNNYNFGYFGLPVRSCWMCKKKPVYGSLGYHFEKDNAVCKEYEYDMHVKGRHKLLGCYLGHSEAQNQDFIMASASVILDLEIEVVPDIDNVKGGIAIGIICPNCGKETSTGSWSFGQGYICTCPDCKKDLLQIDRTEIYTEAYQE